MGKAKRRVSPKVKFQVVLEALTEGKTHGRIAKVYGVHPISLGLWKKTLLERGAEIFAGDSAKEDYERRMLSWSCAKDRLLQPRTKALKNWLCGSVELCRNTQDPKRGGLVGWLGQSRALGRQ